MRKAEEATIGVDRIIDTAFTKIKHSAGRTQPRPMGNNLI